MQTWFAWTQVFDVDKSGIVDYREFIAGLAFLKHGGDGVIRSVSRKRCRR